MFFILEGMADCYEGPSLMLFRCGNYTQPMYRCQVGQVPDEWDPQIKRYFIVYAVYYLYGSHWKVRDGHFSFWIISRSQRYPLFCIHILCFSYGERSSYFIEMNRRQIKYFTYFVQQLKVGPTSFCHVQDKLIKARFLQNYKSFDTYFTLHNFTSLRSITQPKGFPKEEHTNQSKVNKSPVAQMQLPQEVQICIDQIQRKSFGQGHKVPKWLAFYKPKATVNSPEYHFISEPTKQKHQKITVKNSHTSRPITMYLEIEDPQQLQQHYHKARKDQSKLKNFDELNFVEPEDQIVLSKSKTVEASRWAKEYEPKAFYQLLSEELHNRNVLTWLKSWDWIVFKKEIPTITPTVKFQKNTINPQFNKFPQQQQNDYNHSRLLLLSGPPGCGKTTLARVVAKHCGYDVIELNASDDRSGKALIEKIEAMGKNNSLHIGKPTLIIIDEVDGALEQDGNGIKEVLNFIQSGGKKTTSEKHPKEHFPRPSDLPKTEPAHHQKHTLIPRPIIFICNDPFVKGLKQLRSKAIVVYFRQVEKDRMAKRLKEITEKEGVYIENEVLGKIAEITNCDIRSSLGILQYICNAKKLHNQNPKELITKLRLSFQKDSTTSINEFVSSLLNQTRSSSLKTIPNLKEFSYTISKIDNHSLLFEMFFHNFIQYKNFFSRRTKEAVKLYDYLKWVDVLGAQSFKFGGETDVYVMMVFLYYKMHIIGEEHRKIEFPSGFFERLNRTVSFLKQHKETIDQLISKWPAFLQSTVSLGTVIKQYIWLLYYAVQTASNRDSDIIECVGKMITYGIELGPKNGFHLFKPEFDSLLVYDHKKLETLYTVASRNFIEDSYEFAKMKSHLLSDMSLTDLNKNTEELMKQLNIKNRKRKRNPESMGRNSIKYKFIEGSGTQITYDLKFKFFFE